MSEVHITDQRAYGPASLEAASELMRFEEGLRQTLARSRILVFLVYVSFVRHCAL